MVDIRVKDGKQYSKTVYYTKGHPKNPMTFEEVVAKFRRCLAFSARPFPEANAERINELVSGLERLDDVSEITRLMAP